MSYAGVTASDRAILTHCQVIRVLCDRVFVLEIRLNLILSLVSCGILYVGITRFLAEI